jgi:hypothetical protein
MAVGIWTGASPPKLGLEGVQRWTESYRLIGVAIGRR